MTDGGVKWCCNSAPARTVCRAALSWVPSLFGPGGGRGWLYLQNRSLDTAILNVLFLLWLDKVEFSGGERLTISCGVAELERGEDQYDWLRRADERRA